MELWLTILIDLGLVGLFIVFPLVYEYWYERKEKKNANSRTGKKDD